MATSDWVTKKSIYFMFYRSNEASEQIITDLSSISASHYNGSKDTKIIIHGFTHNGHRQWLMNMKQALLDKVKVFLRLCAPSIFYNFEYEKCHFSGTCKNLIYNCDI